jgi:cardiolipin synthase A/B
MTHTTYEKNWSEERLYFDAPSYFHDLLSDIRQARKEIILETYIFKLDTTGRQVLAALVDASMRGIRIRLLIDGVGSSEHAETIASTLQNSDMPFLDTVVRIYHPLPWNFAAYRWTIKRRRKKAQHFSGKLWHFITQLNHRNHRKLCIVDGHIAWLGSFNITSEHQQHNWHDSAVRLIGKPVANLKNNFFHVWQQRDKSSHLSLRHFLSNHSLKWRKQKNAALTRLIQQATNRIWITNAYFSPSKPILKALKAAVKRGVSVKILVPSRSDIALFPALTRTFYADLLAAKMHIFEFNNKILHSKTMLIDKRLIIGSTNLNYRSYFHDLELDAILSNSRTIAIIEKKFSDDLEHSSEINFKILGRFPKAMMLLGWFSRILRYWF